MGVWEQQAKQASEQRQIWSECQQFNFSSALRSATNEEEVKAAYIREFSLPVKTKERHDLLVNKVLFEFKYSVTLSDTKVAAKVVAQAVYYINRLFKKNRLHEVEFLVVADKDEARLFDVTEFQLFYESHEYQWDNFRPSSPDPKLVKAINNSKILESNRVYNLELENDVHLFSSRLYKVLLPPKDVSNIVKSLPQKPNLIKANFFIICFVLAITLISGVFIANQYRFSQIRQSFPVNNQ